MKAMDLIDRKALGVGCANPSVFNDPAYARGWNGLLKIINDAPVVDAEPARCGYWLEENTRPCSTMFRCSECGNIAYDAQRNKSSLKKCQYQYCPHCGAKMSANDKHGIRMTVNKICKPYKCPICLGRGTAILSHKVFSCKACKGKGILWYASVHDDLNI